MYGEPSLYPQSSTSGTYHYTRNPFQGSDLFIDAGICGSRAADASQSSCYATAGCQAATHSTCPETGSVETRA